MRTLKVHSLSSLASLIALIILLFAFNAFCDGDPPEEEDPLPFSTNVIIFSSCNLTNRFAGKLETTNPGISGNWIHIIPQGGTNNFITVCALSTNRYHDVRNKVTCEFQMGNTNENCHVSVNETLVCLWDETADEKGENEDLVKFCKKLSFDDKMSGTILPTFNDTIHDSDVYYFESNGKSGFCFEVDSYEELNFRVSFDSGIWNDIEKARLFDSDGQDIPNHFRLYVSESHITHRYSFIKIYRKNQSSTEINYNITLRKVRPLLLVHGISSEPKVASNNYYHKGIAFQDIYDNISACEDIDPTVPFPFPWDSSDGSYDSYCNGDNSLSAYYTQKANNWYLGPVIVAHSMGGLLSVKQITSDSSFANKVCGIICLGSPFCGSDIANHTSVFADIFGGLNETSPINIAQLARGTPYVLQRLQNFPEALSNFTYVRFFYSTIKFYEYPKKIPLTGEGDGVVNFSSSNVGDTLHWFECKGIETHLKHTVMDELKLKKIEEKYEDIYDAIKNLINQ